MCRLFSEMLEVARVCESCRKQLGILRNEQEGQCSFPHAAVHDVVSDCEIDPDFTLQRRFRELVQP